MCSQLVDSTNWEESLPAALQDLHLEETWDVLQPQVRQLQKALHAAQDVHLTHLRTYVELKQMDLFQDLGWTTTQPSVTPLPAQQLWHCEACSMSFDTSKALAVHMRIKHQHIAAVRRYAHDSNCRVCRKHFHTRPRLIQHWHSSATDCWITIMRRYVPMPSERALELDQQDRALGHALHQHHAKDVMIDCQWRWCQDAELAHGLPLLPHEMVGDVQPSELDAWSQLGALPSIRAPNDTPAEDQLQVPNVMYAAPQLDSACGCAATSCQQLQVCTAAVQWPQTATRHSVLAAVENKSPGAVRGHSHRPGEGEYLPLTPMGGFGAQWPHHCRPCSTAV